MRTTAILSPPTPLIPTEIPGLDVAVGYRSAGSGEEVSGDFYDMFEIAPGDWMVAIGDVSGKGFDAAVLTVLVRDTIREAAFRNPQPSHVLGSLNRGLLGRWTTRFCTAALMRLRRAGDCWKATLSLGGHPLPLLLEAGGSDPIALGRPGTLIGALHRAEYHDRDVLLTPGAQIVLYTDGVCEARWETEYYGEDRLRALIAGRADSGAAATAGAVLDDVLAFQSGQPRDDIAVVVLRVPIRDGSRRRLIRWYCTACDVWGQGHGSCHLLGLRYPDPRRKVRTALGRRPPVLRSSGRNLRDARDAICESATLTSRRNDDLQHRRNDSSESEHHGPA